MAKFTADFNASDAAAVKAAFGKVGESCKACHDDYRKEEGGALAWTTIPASEEARRESGTSRTTCRSWLK